MLFRFLKYLQPTHYFQLYKTDGSSVFPIPERLPKEVLDWLEPDIGFKSETAKQYDLSWQAVNKGYIGKVETYSIFAKVPIEDEYRFIRKNFHSAWVFYVLLLRLFSFHNPIKELKAWFRTRGVTRVAIGSPSIGYPDWASFESALIPSNPKVGVIIPTLNRYIYLKDVLRDLEAQDYPHFEVIIVDQSAPFQESFYKEFNLDIQLIRQEEKALWLARNTAIKAAKGELIALSEDDVRIEPDWISSHLKALDFFEAQVSAGVFYPEGQQIPKDRSFFALASQFATGNAMLYKQVFAQVGLFDRQFEKQRMGDGEFGMRVYLAGIKSISNPYASCIDVKAGTGGLREMGSWDAFRSQNWLDPRPIPSVLYFHRKYFGNYNSRLGLLKTIPTSIMPYRFKGHRMYTILGAILFLFFMPVVLFQVNKSWRLASDKLSCGPLIETID